MSSSIPRHVLRWPEKGVAMAFRRIPAGTFRMGSRGYGSNEEPVHRVRIPHDFWMAETPVTQAQFALWTRAEGIEHQNHFERRPDHPAENLDWHQAVQYGDWLTRTQAHEFPEDFSRACLPTEAEWEYACRAGTETEYSRGDGEAALAEVGWYGEAWGKGSTHPVAQKPANPFGLFDMHGNVWEWCQDVFDAAAYRKRVDGWEAGEWTFAQAGKDAQTYDSGAATEANASRVLRGGSWSLVPWGCRSAFRIRYWPADRFWIIGFRVCLVCGPAAGTDRADRAEPGAGDGGRGTRPESDAAGGARTDVDLRQGRLPPMRGVR